jgi:flagellar basal-body rod protein FlgB
MDLSQVPLFSALMKRMSWLTERQTVLAENVANADTPGYQAQDLAEPDFRKLLSQTAGSATLATTQPGHFQVKHELVDFSAQETKAVSPTGGKLTIEDEMMKVSETANDYALVSTVYRANLAMVKAVLGRSS